MAKRKRADDRMLLVPQEIVQGRANQCTILSTVGSGAYATVYAAKDNLGRKVALKEFVPASHPREAPMLRSLFERERFVLSLVSSHPLMPTFYDAFETDNHFYLAQEFIEGKTLDEVIANTRINNDWMLRWAASLCYALTYLHSLQIVHHDLKPANIRIRPNGRLALLDFGAARYFGTSDNMVPESFTEDDELYGTEGYLPPEVEGDGTFNADVRTDIFALGCILYEMVMGEPPEQKKINERTSFITTPLMSRKDVNLDYVKLVTTALSFNTEYRYASAQVFLDALKPITPPLLMISTKQIAFGRRDIAEGQIKRKFTIFNGTSGGEFSGDVKAMCNWITVEMPAFRGQKRDMVIVADPSKIKERNQLVRGTIEVWAAEKYDENNRPVSKSEKLYIECTIIVSPSPARLALLQPPTDGEPGIALKVRKGVDSSVIVAIGNSGESKVDIRAMVPTESGLTVTPTFFSLEGNSSAQVTVTAPANADIKFDTVVPLQFAPVVGHGLDTNIILRAGSIVDGLRGLFKR